MDTVKASCKSRCSTPMSFPLAGGGSGWNLSTWSGGKQNWRGVGRYVEETGRRCLKMQGKEQASQTSRDQSDRREWRKIRN